MRTRRLGSLAVAALILVACNPLHTDPVPLGAGNELEQTSAQYSGASPAWIEIAAAGAPEHFVYAFAVVLKEDLTGPTDRSCAASGDEITPCTVTSSDVRMTNQRIVPGDESDSVRLMTLWSAERVQIVLVCVDPATQELGCPASLRTTIRAVDSGGDLVGDLVT